MDQFGLPGWQSVESASNHLESCLSAAATNFVAVADQVEATRQHGALDVQSDPDGPHRFFRRASARSGDSRN